MCFFFIKISREKLLLQIKRDPLVSVYLFNLKKVWAPNIKSMYENSSAKYNYNNLGVRNSRIIYGTVNPIVLPLTHGYEGNTPLHRLNACTFLYSVYTTQL